MPLTSQRLGGYNEHGYNEPLYNDNDIYAVATDSASCTDSRIADAVLARAEAVAMADALVKFFNDGAILDDILVTPDTLLKAALLAKADAVSPSDVLVPLALKLLVESLAPADVRIVALSTMRGDTTVLVDTLTRQITNKGLADLVKLNDWFGARVLGSSWYD